MQILKRERPLMPRCQTSRRASGSTSACSATAQGRGGEILPPAPLAPASLAAFGAAVDWAVVAIGAVMIALVFVNVLLHVVGKDLAWVTELAELLMVWVTFLGGACAARRGAQMTITEFIDKLGGSAPERGRRRRRPVRRWRCWARWSGTASTW